MKDFDYLLNEIPAPDETLMLEPRFVSVFDLGKVYRLVIRTAELYSAFVVYNLLYKHYPSPEWFQSEALFELTCCQSSLFE